MIPRHGAESGTQRIDFIAARTIRSDGMERAVHCSVMSARPLRLSRHLAVIVLVKALLLGAIWWAFFRDARVEVTAERAADRVLAPPSDTRETPP